MTEPNRGRVTIPTDMDVVPETLKILDYWGAVPSATATARNSLKH